MTFQPINPKTPEQVAVLQNKLKSEAWRMTNLYCIEDKWGELVHFKPNFAQVRFFKEMHEGVNVILKARQLGLSTGIVLWILDKLLTNENHRAGIVDKTLDDAEAKLAKIAMAYENLDNKQLLPGASWKVGRFIKDSIPMEATSKRIKFKNGSSITAGTSLRGGTLQYLHVSELGYIAINDPKKAEEIVSGSFNTIAPGNYIFSESTHEGGRLGLHYKLLTQAMENDPKHLTPIDSKFFFFPWFKDPSYSLGDNTEIKLRPDTEKYFERLKKDSGIELGRGQMAWYDRKSKQQHEAMLKEFPSTPEEAFEASIRGAIYAKEITAARASGRICDFTPDENAPVVTGWDIGVSDYTSIWAVQFVGREIFWLNWYENSNEKPSHYAAKMREWDRLYGNIAMHYLPHDAGAREKSGYSYIHYLNQAGLVNATIVPRISDIWIGINQFRDLIPRSVFHKTNCGTERVDELGDKHPSGIACLEGYRTGGIGMDGKLKEVPIHDATSHSASAARTIAEAYSRGMINVGAMGASNPRQFKPRVISGEAPVKRRQKVRVISP